MDKQRTIIKGIAIFFILVLSAIISFLVIPKVAETRFNFNEVRVEAPDGIINDVLVVLISESKDTIPVNDGGKILKMPEISGVLQFEISYLKNNKAGFTHVKKTIDNDYIYKISIDSSLNVNVVADGAEEEEWEFILSK